MTHRTDRRWLAAGCSYLAAYASACLATHLWTGFFVDLNDFWGNVALAELADWRAPSSLYNLFFPFGYTLLLSLWPSDPIVPAHLVNLASGLLLSWSTWRCAALMAGEPWGIAAMVLVSVDPQVFRYATTPGPDMFVTALCALGFVRLWSDDERPGPATFVSGALLGAAALLRYHAMVFAGAAIVATSIARRGWLRHVALAFGGFLTVYAAQMLVAVSAGHSPFHTGQAFIFHKLMYGVNWFQVTSVSVPDSPLAVVRESPSAFASAYLRMLQLMWMLPLAPALLAVAASDPRRRRFGFAALGIMLLYLPVVASGGSSRGSLPVHFLVALSAAALACEAVALCARRRPGLATVATAVLLALGGGWALVDARTDHGIVKRRRTSESTYREVETLLKADGVRSAKSIFASDFTLYFTSLASFTPRTNGSWLRIDNPRYAAAYPELCVAAIDCFAADARRLGVTHVVLTPDAIQLSPPFADVYDGRHTAGLELRGTVAAFKVFKIP